MKRKPKKSDSVLVDTLNKLEQSVSVLESQSEFLLSTSTQTGKDISALQKQILALDAIVLRLESAEPLAWKKNTSERIQNLSQSQYVLTESNRHLCKDISELKARIPELPLMWNGHPFEWNMG